MSARLGHVRSAMSMGVNGRYLVDGVRNMVGPLQVSRANSSGRKARSWLAGWGDFSVSPVLLAPTVGAWGLLRLEAQKRKRER